jgi:hypothetical protein
METAKMPPSSEWIKKMWYLYTMEFYSAMRNNEIMWLEGKWMQLEDIILSEVSQAQKDKSHMFSLTCGRQTQYKYKPYYVKQVTLRGDHIREKEDKRRKLRR